MYTTMLVWLEELLNIGFDIDGDLLPIKCEPTWELYNFIFELNTEKRIWKNKVWEMNQEFKRRHF